MSRRPNSIQTRGGILLSAILSVFPTYPIDSVKMRPVTKISLFGFRLAAIALAVYWIAIFVGTHLPVIHKLPTGMPQVSDKTKHYWAYFFLALMMCYTTTSPRWLRRFGTIAGVGILYAAVDEWSQRLVAGRVSDIHDFFADVLGLFSAIALYLAAKCCYQQWTQRSRRQQPVSDSQL